MTTTGITEATELVNTQGQLKKSQRSVRRVKGKCRSCGLHLRPTDFIEVDHIVPRSKTGNNTYKNKQGVNRHCYDSKTAEDLKGVNL